MGKPYHFPEEPFDREGFYRELSEEEARLKNKRGKPRLDIREDTKLDEDQKANTLITKEAVAPILPPPATKEEE